MTVQKDNARFPIFQADLIQKNAVILFFLKKDFPGAIKFATRTGGAGAMSVVRVIIFSNRDLLFLPDCFIL